MEIAFGISVLVFLSCLVWHYYPLYDLAVAALNGDAAARASVESAFGNGSATGNGPATGTPISSGGQPYTETTTSEGGFGIIGYGERGYALRFREDRWHQPAEHRLPEFGNKWVGERHSGVELRRAAPSFPTAVSRPTVVSRPRR